MASAATSIAWNRKLANAVVGRKTPSTDLYHRPLDSLAVFETACQCGSTTAPTRYAIRQALDQEYQKCLLRQRPDARQARHKAGGGLGPDADIGVDEKGNASTQQKGVNLKPVALKRDFFGRITDVPLPTIRGPSSQDASDGSHDPKLDKKGSVWVSYHEGFSNAVRKPITLDELLRGF